MGWEYPRLMVTFLPWTAALKPTPWISSFFTKPSRDAANHVVDQRPAQAVQGLGLGVVTLAADEDLAALDLEAGAAGQLPVELALGAFDRDLLAGNLDLHLGRDGDGLFSYS